MVGTLYFSTSTLALYFYFLIFTTLWMTSLYCQHCRDRQTTSGQWCQTDTGRCDVVIQVALKLPSKYTLHYIHPC